MKITDPQELQKLYNFQKPLFQEAAKQLITMHKQ
jgi:hypothetical protein